MTNKTANDSQQGVLNNNLPEIIETKSGRYMIFSRKDHIAEHLIKNGAWEEHTFQLLCALMDKRGGDVLDIGANMGAITVPLARIHPSRQFYCFEAQKRVYMQLCGNVILNGLPNVHPLHMAIGDPKQAGEVIEVPVPDYRQDANIGAVTLDDRVNKANRWSYPAHEKVALMKIDDLGLNNIGIVKIDVEGMERDVLFGMKETLIRCGYPSILFEIWRDGRYEWVEEERAEVVSFLEDLGYRVDLFQQVTTAMAQHESVDQLDIKIESKPR